MTLSGCSALRHCAPPSAEYFLEADCDAIAAGETCAARCAESQCLSGGPVVFECPQDNLDVQQRPTWVSGRCRSRCEICRASIFVDLDPRRGMLQGTLQFGEAHANGVMPVDGSHGDHVFVADDCGRRIGASLGYLPRLETYSCCAVTAYSLEISGAVPPGATSMVVAVNSSYGELPFPKSVTFNDLQETEAPTTLRPITAFGKRTAVSALSALFAFTFVS